MPGPRADDSPGHLVAALVLATLTVSTVATLGTPLIPTIAREQDVSLETAQWMLTMPVLTGVIATPTLGRLGDGAQRRNVLAGALAIVVLGCVVSALSRSFGQLLAGRALQGVGWGAAPIALAIAREQIPLPRVGRTIALLGVLVSVGTGLGFPVTSLITELLGFHAAFWWGAGFSLCALIAVLAAIPGAPGAGRPRLDVAGALLLGGGLGAGVLAVSRGETWGWTSGRILGLFAASAVLLVAFLVVERGKELPLVDLRVVSQRTVLGTNVAALLLGLSIYIALSLVNRLAQTPVEVSYGFGASIVLTGLLLMPMSLGSLASQPITNALAPRVGARGALVYGALVVSATLVMLAGYRGFELQLGLATALIGIGVGATFAAMPGLIVAAVPRGDTGSATSLNQVSRMIGGAVGSAAGATILTAHTLPGATYPSADGYTVAFAIAAAVALIAALVAFLLVPRRQGSPPPAAAQDPLVP
jgi:predicted MFS family arabinose efflux permease